MFKTKTATLDNQSVWSIRISIFGICFGFRYLDFGFNDYTDFIEKMLRVSLNVGLHSSTIHP
jgi:hypothetical protein